MVSVAGALPATMVPVALGGTAHSDHSERARLTVSLPVFEPLGLTRIQYVPVEGSVNVSTTRSPVGRRIEMPVQPPTFAFGINRLTRCPAFPRRAQPRPGRAPHAA